MKEDKFCLNKSVAFLAVVVLFILGVVFVSTQLNQQNLAGNSKAAGSCVKDKLKWEQNTCLKETGDIVQNSDKCAVTLPGQSACCGVAGIPSWLKTGCDNEAALRNTDANIAAHAEGVFWENGGCLEYYKNGEGNIERRVGYIKSCCNLPNVPQSVKNDDLCTKPANLAEFYSTHALGKAYEGGECLNYFKDTGGYTQRSTLTQEDCCDLSGIPTWLKDGCAAKKTYQASQTSLANHSTGFAWEGGGCLLYSGSPGSVERGPAPRGNADCCCGPNKQPLSGVPGYVCSSLNLANWCQ